MEKINYNEVIKRKFKRTNCNDGVKSKTISTKFKIKALKDVIEMVENPQYRATVNFKSTEIYLPKAFEPCKSQLGESFWRDINSNIY